MAGTRMIGVSMESSWPWGSPYNDGWLSKTHPPSHTNTHIAKSILNAKLVPKSSGETKVGARVIGVSMESSWLQGHHNDGWTTHPNPHLPPQRIRKINIKCKTCPGKNLENQGRWPRWLGCIWKGLDLKVTTQMDPYQPILPHIHIKNALSLLYAKLVPEESGVNQGRCEGDWGVYGKVLTSGSPHNGQTSHQPIRPHPHPKSAKSMLYANIVPKSLEKPRQVRGWLGCLWKGINLRVTTQWMDPTPPHPPPTPTPKMQNQCYMQNLSWRAWRNQGRYKGDWGVYGKVLTSGSQHNGRTNLTTTNHHSDWTTYVLPAGVSCRRPKAALLRVFSKGKNCKCDIFLLLCQKLVLLIHLKMSHNKHDIFISNFSKKFKNI